MSGIDRLANYLSDTLKAQSKKSVAIVGYISGSSVITNHGSYSYDVNVDVSTSDGDYVTVILDENGRAKVIGRG